MNLYAVSINDGDLELKVAAPNLKAALLAALKQAKVDGDLLAVSIEVVDEVLVVRE